MVFADIRAHFGIVCPFIKRRAVARILSTRPPLLRVITRFSLPDFAMGVNDIEALRLFLNADGAVRGVHGLHAKLYIFGTGLAIITSANLTGAGLTANREFGVVTEDSAAVERCLAWFDALWQDAGNDLQRSQLDSWALTLSNHLTSGAPPSESGDLGDLRHPGEPGIPAILQPAAALRRPAPGVRQVPRRRQQPRSSRMLHHRRNQTRRVPLGSRLSDRRRQAPDWRPG